MVNTPLQDIQTLQTDVAIFDGWLKDDQNTQIDFSSAQDGSDMRASLSKFLATVTAAPAAAGGPVRLALAAALPAFSYNNGAAGVGATITANANGALGNIDGQAPIVGDRIWVWDYTGAGGTNVAYGIYTVTSLGSGAAPWVMTRAVDADTAAEIGMAYAYVRQGAANAGLVIQATLAPSAITLGTTAIAGVVVSGNAAVGAETARAEGVESAIEGGKSACAVTEAANFAPDATAYLWPLNAAAGNIVVTIPAGATFPNQKWKFVRTDNSAHTVTITMSGADTLNGAATQPLAGQWSKMEIHNQRGTSSWYVTGT